ncbi:MAG: rhamnulokinase [Phycisphaerae bacterium]|nr:rhamnulokinase [Phycisphaerae bacterium]
MSDAGCYVAVDLGAESGRVMRGVLSKGKLTLDEVHRFANGPVEQDGSLRWDFERLMAEIKAGLQKVLGAGHEVASIGIDTWGVDFGLLDARGRLIEDPYHYRDSRTDGMMERAFALMPKDQIYRHTGIQFMQLNSLFQVLALKTRHPEVLAKTKHVLFMPDLITYTMTGDVSVEYTIASTSQMMDMRTGQWSTRVLQALGLPASILPKVVPPGASKGMLRSEIARELGCGPVPVVAVGTHDTASAVAGVPVTKDRPWAYLSSGTWSLMGIESPKAVINQTTSDLSFTNEGGVEGTIRVLKNIMGLWLVQECRRHWAGQGQDLGYSQLTDMAAQAEPFQAVISTEHGDFFAPGRMPEKINRFLQSTGQAEIADKGQMVRAILESLAVRYAQVMGWLEQISGRPIEVLHVVGGGIQNELLNQFTANATGKTVVAGPVEATVLGNILIQAKAAGQIQSLAEGRALVAKSFKTKTYRPKGRRAWQAFANRAEPILRS